MNHSFSQAALLICLRNLFNKSSYFDVTALKTALDVAGIFIPSSQMDVFRALHCVHYADMPKGFKRQLADEILALFENPADYKVHFDVDPSGKLVATPLNPMMLKAPEVLR